MMSKSIFENFDPNAAAISGNCNIFGLPSTYENSDLIILPIPWDLTTSYRQGTSSGPKLVYEASMQVDLYDADYTHAWKNGFYMLEIDRHHAAINEELRADVDKINLAFENGENILHNQELTNLLKKINQASSHLNQWVYQQCKKIMDDGKMVALLGGDHSTPYGFIKALSEKHDNFGILQIDAHADLRAAYQGFTFSHASIMYNVVNNIPQVSKLVQIGIRDYCDEEINHINNSQGRIHTFFDSEIKQNMYEGKTWKTVCEEIIAALPSKVYISFDIDGLDPKLCPNTGTPVPGGFEQEQIFYLLKLLKQSNKKLIGFDLNEVSGASDGSDSIDSMVGARVLYKLCGHLITVNSQDLGFLG